MSFAPDIEAVMAAFSQPNNDGSFSGALGGYVRGISKRKPVVMFAFAPKSAGTFLRSAAIFAIRGQLLRIVHAQGGRDAQLYFPTFIAYYLGAFGEEVVVAHVHMQALPGNRNFIEAFDLKPVVMIRSIPDMLASYWDMLEGDAASRDEGLNCRIPKTFPTMAREEKANFLIDIMGPWYASYFATWLDYASDSQGRVLLLRYEDFLVSPSLTLERALAHAGAPSTAARCRSAIDAAWNERDLHRFNRGRSSRGREYFTPDQIARLAHMLSYYRLSGEVGAELLA
jgi:hypothetical protein